MPKSKSAKTVLPSAPAALPKKHKPKKTPKNKPSKTVDIAKLRELMKTHKPPQSWYDEDHTGLY
jgi:hypothetical protein